ncbi:MAG TPA: hypothetical protein VFB38_11180 [Chthonomonadaceae bacterium]|nr:hypothetical protein [Chthonomonadaceae bacterium]
MPDSATLRVGALRRQAQQASVFRAIEIFQNTRGHFEQGNYAFVDGHIKTLRWPQVRGNDFQLFKLHKPQQTSTP